MEMIEQFSAERHRAQEALVLGNIFRRELTTKEDSL